MQTPTVRWQNSVVTSHHHQGSAGKQAGTEDLPAFNILFSSFHLKTEKFIFIPFDECARARAPPQFIETISLSAYLEYFSSLKKVFLEIFYRQAISDGNSINNTDVMMFLCVLCLLLCMKGGRGSECGHN